MNQERLARALVALKESELLLAGIKYNGSAEKALKELRVVSVFLNGLIVEEEVEG